MAGTHVWAGASWNEWVVGRGRALCPSDPSQLWLGSDSLKVSVLTCILLKDVLFHRAVFTTASAESAANQLTLAHNSSAIAVCIWMIRSPYFVVVKNIGLWKALAVLWNFSLRSLTFLECVPLLIYLHEFVYTFWDQPSPLLMGSDFLLLYFFIAVTLIYSIE